jgi:hypothetical protein
MKMKTKIKIAMSATAEDPSNDVKSNLGIMIKL